MAGKGFIQIDGIKWELQGDWPSRESLHGAFGNRVRGLFRSGSETGAHELFKVVIDGETCDLHVRPMNVTSAALLFVESANSEFVSFGR